MIKFFRKSRKEMLTEGKIGKYLKYALGEIILVVIGILIALQINNWNSNTIVNEKTDTYLDALNTELESNITAIERHIDVCYLDLQTHSETLTYLHAETGFNDSILVTEMVTRPIYKPTLIKSTFTDLINSGYLEHVTDIDLKSKILAIDADIDLVYEKYSHAKDVWEKYQLPYLMKNSNVSGNWDSIGPFKIQKLPYKRRSDAFVNNKEYADILVLRMRMVDNLEHALTGLKERFITLADKIKTRFD